LYLGEPPRCVFLPARAQLRHRARTGTRRAV